MKIASRFIGLFVVCMFGSHVLAAATDGPMPAKGEIHAASTTLLTSSSKEGSLIQYSNMQMSLGGGYSLRAPAATSFQANGGPTFVDASSAVISSGAGTQQPLYLTGAHVAFAPNGATEITADHIYINGQFRRTNTADAIPDGIFPPPNPPGGAVTCTADHHVAVGGVDQGTSSICVGTIEITCSGKNGPVVIVASSNCT
jgi:hypothetical protein